VQAVQSSSVAWSSVTMFDGGAIAMRLLYPQSDQVISLQI
jgi:hypothetical protein